MFFLTKRNKFRIFFIRLIENTWFERLVSLNIILCSIALFLYTYADLLCPERLSKQEMQACLKTYESDINRDKILNMIFSYFFNVIFLIEFICKIIAKGFILHKRAYLRSFWNAIDCFATVYSFLEGFYPFLGKMVILRVIRLLRIIKNIKSFESIKKPINCIMLAIPTIANVLLFLAFIFTVFATLGIQLFSGAFYKRCRANPIAINIEEGNTLKFQADPVTPYLCNQEGLFGKCPLGTHCVGFFDIPSFFNMTQNNITIEHFDIERENLKSNSFLFYAIPNFDTIINCFINVFVILTYQNWTDISSIIIDANSTLMVNLYFNIIVIFGGFFIMKMIFAAQNEVFIKVKEDEQENKLLMLQNFSRANPKLASLVDIDKLLQDINSMESGELFKKIEKVIAQNQSSNNILSKKDHDEIHKKDKNDKADKYDKSDCEKNTKDKFDYNEDFKFEKILEENINGYKNEASLENKNSGNFTGNNNEYFKNINSDEDYECRESDQINSEYSNEYEDKREFEDKEMNVGFKDNITEEKNLESNNQGEEYMRENKGKL